MYRQLTKKFISIAVQLPSIAVDKDTSVCSQKNHLWTKLPAFKNNIFLFLPFFTMNVIDNMHNTMDYKRYKNIVYKVIGAAMTVHRELGSGLLEPIYNEALTMELTDVGLQAEPEQEVFCYYKGRKLDKTYRMDILVEKDIVVELKSTEEICPEHRFQLFNYLRLTKKPVGLLINFGSESLYGERYGYNPQTNECILLSKDMNPYYRD